MTRPALRVRPAKEHDLPALLALGEELREQLLSPDRTRSAGATRELLQARYAEALLDRRRHVVVVVEAGAGPAADGAHGADGADGTDGGEQVLGMALFSVAGTGALLDQPAVHVHHAVVADRHRRRGAGRALVAAAAAFAEERGLEQVVVSVHPGSREANRFFARLGFAPVSVRRSATVAAIRRRLAAGEGRVAEHLVRRRRRPDRSLRDVLPLAPCWSGELERRSDDDAVLRSP